MRGSRALENKDGSSGLDHSSTIDRAMLAFFFSLSQPLVLHWSARSLNLQPLGLLCSRLGFVMTLRTQNLLIGLMVTRHLQIGLMRNKAMFTRCFET
jgi:hypothetical protein